MELPSEVCGKTPTSQHYSQGLFGRNDWTTGRPEALRRSYQSAQRPLSSLGGKELMTSGTATLIPNEFHMI